MTCNLCSTSVQITFPSPAYLTSKGCKHAICKICIGKILRERAAGAWIPCPINGCTGKIDVEDERYDVVITPEKGPPRGDSDDASPDIVTSYKVVFDERDYTDLCKWYLTEQLIGGKKRRRLDAADYDELMKEVDRYLQKEKHEKVYELLVQLREHEMNPRKVPHLLMRKSVDGVAQVIDLTGDDAECCIDVDSQVHVAMPEVEKNRAVKQELELDVMHVKKVATDAKVEAGRKTLFDELSDSKEDISSDKKIDRKPTVKKEQVFYHENNVEFDSDEESRFSQGCTISEDNKDEIKSESNGSANSDGESVTYVHESNNDPYPELTQEEIDADKAEKARTQRAKLRKYGDRVLLSRQGGRGMIELGGGNVDADMWWHNEDDPRREEVFGGDFHFRYCLALNEYWNFDGPKYAGQVTAAISHSPPPDGYDVPFSIFMRRLNRKERLLGWEYCGEYIGVEDGMDESWMPGVPSNQVAKDYILEKIKNSLRLPSGYWHEGIARHRERVTKVLQDEPHSGDAETLRKLGLDNDQLTDSKFAEKLVNWPGFMSHKIVKFVEYDELMYSFVKTGETAHDKDGKMVKSSRLPCAKASDWYGELDQMVAGL